MDKTKIYTLKPEQLDFYEFFRRIGYDNADFMFSRIVDFIRFQHKSTGLPVAVVGASGGIDSSFVLAAAVKALGVENVRMVMLPYDGIDSSCEDSIRYATLLGDYLGVPEYNRKIIPISRAVDASRRSVMGHGFRTPSERQVGNMMARERMKILYHVADEYKGLVLDTCNNTEIIMGYLTKHGDGASDYNPVGDLYKVWIWEIAKKLKLTPVEIIEREPSADLIPGQTDVEDLGIAYEPLDLLLWLYFNNHATIPVLTSDYFYPAEVVNMVMKRVDANRHKSNPVPVCRVMDPTDMIRHIYRYEKTCV
jgi:NAD+ synthetase